MDPVIDAYIRYLAAGEIQRAKTGSEVRSLHRLIEFLRDLEKLEPEPHQFRAALDHIRGNLKGTPLAVWLQQESGAHSNHVFLGTGYRLTWANPRGEYWVPVFKPYSEEPVFLRLEDAVVDGPPRVDETGCFTQRRYSKLEWGEPTPDIEVLDAPPTKADYMNAFVEDTRIKGCMERARKNAMLDVYGTTAWMPHGSAPGWVITDESAPVVKGPYKRLVMDMRSDGCASKIPGARYDWAPSQPVTYEPDLGEDLELSAEEERAWRTKR